MALSKVSTEKASNDSQNSKITDKKEKPPTKVIVRRLPPHMTEEEFINHVSPIPDYDYMYLVKGDMSLGENAFARVYINFTSIDDVYIFNEKFDNYVFLDAKGHEYKAVVEFASFQKIPRRRKPRPDPKCASLESDPLYIEFVNSLNEPEPSLEEKPEYTFQPNTDNKNDVSTPLLDYLKQRKVEKQKIREEKREERRKKDIERKRVRDDERRKRFEDKSPKKETGEEIDKKARWTKPERVKNGPEKDKEEKPAQFTEKNFVNSKLKKAHKGEPFEEHKEYRNRREREYKPKMERKTFEERKENDRKTYEDRKDDRKSYEDRKDSERKTYEDRKENERKTYEDRKDDRKMFEDRKDDRKTYEERKENESKPPVVSRKVKKYSERREERKSEAKKAEKLSEVKEEKIVVEKVSLANLEISSSSKVEINEEEIFVKAKEDPKEVVDKKKEEKVEKYGNEEPSCSKEGYLDNEDGLEGNEERFEHRKRNKENDPRVQRRIRNKDRPTMAIYQPGMLKKKPESSQTSEKEDN